ncbi:hypothetical protein C0J45_23822, partial [Silurus meridionalis]
VVNEQDIHKVSLDGRPETVEELNIIVKEKCKLEDDFSLLYEDPDFDHSLCNLDDVQDLPPTKATVKVLPLVTLTQIPTSTSSLSEVSSDDSEFLLTPSSSTRQGRWAECFDIPNFPVDVEFRLRRANLLFLRDRTYLNVPRDMKHGILE